MHLNGEKCHLKGKASRKLANRQNIDYSEKENGSAEVAYPRYQVSVYKTIGPLVEKCDFSARSCKDIMILHFGMYK